MGKTGRIIGGLVLLGSLGLIGESWHYYSMVNVSSEAETLITYAAKHGEEKEGIGMSRNEYKVCFANDFCYTVSSYAEKEELAKDPSSPWLDIEVSTPGASSITQKIRKDEWVNRNPWCQLVEFQGKGVDGEHIDFKCYAGSSVPPHSTRDPTKDCKNEDLRYVAHKSREAQFSRLATIARAMDPEIK